MSLGHFVEEFITPVSQILILKQNFNKITKKKYTLNTKLNVLPKTKFALRGQWASGQNPDGISTSFSFAFNFFFSYFPAGISLRGFFADKC
jgi:hypothetical protein